MGTGDRDDAAPGPRRDPGLAYERTELAWMRTTVSLLALGAAVVKMAPVAGLVMLAMGACAWGVGRRSVPRRPRPGARRLLVLTVAVTVVSLVALAVAVTADQPMSLPTRTP